MDVLQLNLPQEEDSLVVAAALAFINSLETVVTVVDGVEVQDTAGSTTGSGEDSTHAASDDSVVPQPTPKTKPRRKRKSKPGYSTEQGRRKKAELLTLRDEVAGLEEWLQQLKRIKPNLVDIAPVGHSGVSQASMDAMNEFEKRRRSERVNAKLKEILEQQVKVTEELSSAFRKTPVAELMSSPVEPCLRVDNTPTPVDQLGDQVARLYLDCDSVFPKTYLPSFGCTMKPAVDQYRGRVMEIVARAPLACPMKRASDILWQELSTVRKYPDKVYRYMTERGPEAVAKGFDMTLRSRRGTTAVNGLQFMKKFEESDRVVQVRAYTLLLPTEGVRLRGHAWTVISKSAADPHKSDVQFYLQLFVETQSGVYPRKDDIDYIREVGLEAWSLKMRMYSVWLQEMVVEKATVA